MLAAETRAGNEKGVDEPADITTMAVTPAAESELFREWLDIIHRETSSAPSTSNNKTRASGRMQFSPVLCAAVAKGVPETVRGMVWQELSRSHQLRHMFDDSVYDKLQEGEVADEKILVRDMARTFPENDVFKEKDGYGADSSVCKE